VLWSVYCELAYYLFYPLFLKCRRLITMKQVLMTSIAVSVFTAATLGRVSFIWQYGAGTALVCFPLWVAGAWLAERHSSADLLPCRSMLGWRVAALLMCFAANLTDTLLATGNAPMLVFAAAGTFCWHYIPRELARWQLVQPFAILEQLGRASYSLYLVHILPIALAIQFAITWSFGLVVVAEAITIGSATFCFFVLCERRSHQFARGIGRSRSNPRNPLTRAASAMPAVATDYPTA
jgi:peptidoglycan/LPS O-acetylase OafA/YrhL